MKQRVVCAAMLMDDGHIVTGIRHFSPEMRATMRRLYPQRHKWSAWLIGCEHIADCKPYHLRVKEQGFVDQWGRFLTRKEAWVIADSEGQIRLYDPANKHESIPRAANQGDVEELFSENLY